MLWQMHRLMLLHLVRQALAGAHQALGCGLQALALLLVPLTSAVAAAALTLLKVHQAMLVVLLLPRVLRWCHAGGAAAAGQTWRAACTTSSWPGALQLRSLGRGTWQEAGAFTSSAEAWG
jgi:hypothetical protein